MTDEDKQVALGMGFGFLVGIWVWMLFAHSIFPDVSTPAKAKAVYEQRVTEEDDRHATAIRGSK